MVEQRTREESSVWSGIKRTLVWLEQTEWGRRRLGRWGAGRARGSRAFTSLEGLGILFQGQEADVGSPKYRRSDFDVTNSILAAGGRTDWLGGNSGLRRPMRRPCRVQVREGKLGPRRLPRVRRATDRFGVCVAGWMLMLEKRWKKSTATLISGFSKTVWIECFAKILLDHWHHLCIWAKSLLRLFPIWVRIRIGSQNFWF